MYRWGYLGKTAGRWLSAPPACAPGLGGGGSMSTRCQSPGRAGGDRGGDGRLLLCLPEDHAPPHPPSSRGSRRHQDQPPPAGTRSEGPQPGRRRIPPRASPRRQQSVACLPLPVSTHNFARSGVIIIERTYKHTVPFHASAWQASRAPSSHPSEPRSPHPLPYSHAQPAPAPRACFG